MRDRRADDIAHRKTALTGVNEFPNLAEKPLARAEEAPGVYRYAAGFEALRDRSDAYLAEHGTRPQAVLLPLGPLAEHNIRTTFAANLLASGGIEAVNPGTVDAAGVAAAVDGHRRRGHLRHRRPLRHRGRGGGGRRARRRRRPRLPGRTGEGSGERREGPARPDDYLTAKINAVEALATLLTRLGA